LFRPRPQALGAPRRREHRLDGGLCEESDEGVKTAEIEPTFESWQAVARALLHEEVPPAQGRWHEGAKAGQASLLAGATPAAAIKVPREFVDLARQAACADDPGRWHLLYETLWRLTHGDRDLLKNVRDPGIRRLRLLAADKDDESHA